MANVYEAWRGAVEPLDDGTATGNIYEAWRGAVEPTETAAAGGNEPLFYHHQRMLSRCS